MDTKHIKDRSREYLAAIIDRILNGHLMVQRFTSSLKGKFAKTIITDERGDVPGWVLVVLMTTGLVTAIWTIAAPRLSTILRNSLDSMNNVR